MPEGKDPRTADGLGGVHKLAVARQEVAATRPDAERPVVAEATRAGFSQLVDDPDQVAKVIHTADAPDASFQDARVSPEEPSVWTAAKTPDAD